MAASSKTQSSDIYAINPLPTGSYRIGFVDCSHHRYLRQYYKDKPSLPNADPIQLLTTTTRSRINAAMVNRS